jgi:DNA-binding FadR family transcriptional regulator
VEDISRKSNLSFRVTRDLGRAIVRGDFGASIPFPTEADLCRDFGVSRTAVREAVKMLAAKGLVSSKPRQGIRVLPEESWNIFDPDLLQWSLDSRLTRPLLKEFFQMRMAIEPEAAALGAGLRNAKHLRQIAGALERMKAAPANSEASRTADIEFHVAILYATENRFYIRMRDFVRTALDVSIRFTSPPSHDIADAIAAHASVFQAISAGNSGRARSLMQKLISDAYDLL